MRKRFEASQVGLFLFYLGLGFVSSLVWFRIADLPRLPSWHMEMILGQAPAPNQYRPLTPWLAEGLRLALPSQNVFTAYVVLRGLTTGLGLFFFDRYLRVWFTRSAAVGGALALAAIVPFTYFRVVQESDPINLLVFVLAYWAMAVERDVLLFPLMLVGTLNRETTALIPALYFAARIGARPGRKVASMTAGLAACWIGVYGGLRLLYGPRGYYCDVLMWGRNIASWGPTIQVLLLFGALWVLAWFGARKAPTLLRRSLWLLPPYLALHYVVAMVNEVRLFLPYAPSIIPLAWWALFPDGLLPEAPKQAARRAATRAR